MHKITGLHVSTVSAGLSAGAAKVGACSTRDLTNLGTGVGHI